MRNRLDSMDECPYLFMVLQAADSGLRAGDRVARVRDWRGDSSTVSGWRGAGEVTGEVTRRPCQ